MFSTWFETTCGYSLLVPRPSGGVRADAPLVAASLRSALPPAAEERQREPADYCGFYVEEKRACRLLFFNFPIII